MNALELFVYNRVKNRPELKRRIVRAYQAACALVPQRALVSRGPVDVREGFFYGFHDKTPFAPDNGALLAHRDLVGNRSVRPGDAAEVGRFTGPGWRHFEPVAVTRAWDWQLGSMLQWRGARSGEVVFNDRADGAIVSRVATTTGTVTVTHAHAAVHVSADGAWASSYCFRRVGKAMPGYGVRVEGDERGALHAFRCDDDASFRVFSLADGRVRFRYTLEQVAAIEPHPSMAGAFHYFHHSLFNPSGTRLFFFHRWVDRAGRRWTRMFSCGVAGDALFVLPTHEMVSHVTWLDDVRLLAYARTREHGDGYYVLHDRTPRCDPVAREAFNSDGHPMGSPAADAFVTDTYPDRFRNQYLYLYERGSRGAIRLARTHLPRVFLDDLQVDLHPRFDRSGAVVCFDSGHTGRRALCTIAIGELARA